MQFRRTTAVFLLAVFVLHCFGLQIIAGLQLIEHRSAMRASCKEIQPHFNYTAAELSTANWIHASEFVLNGRRYDVAFVEKTESGIVYYVIADSREDRLRAQQEVLNHQNDQEKSGSTHSPKKGIDNSTLLQITQMNIIPENKAFLYSVFQISGCGFRPVPPDPPPPRIVA